MLDINKIRTNKEEIKKNLLKRIEEKDFNLDEIIAIDDKRKKLLAEVEILKAERNRNSHQKPDPETIIKMKAIGDKITEADNQIRNVEEELKDKVSALPNIVADDVIAGGKENNKVIKTFGKKPVFKFIPKDHVQLATELGLIDYERAAKMSGTGFWIYKGNGAVLEWALLNYFIAFHRKNKYTFLIPPFLLTEKSAYTSGHLPKFRDDLFWTQDKLCLDATSEMMIGNYHRDEVLEEKMLPLKYFAYSACFRREGGGYRKEERGMIRGHQFNKIEMFHFTRPENPGKPLKNCVKTLRSLFPALVCISSLSSWLPKTFQPQWLKR